MHLIADRLNSRIEELGLNVQTLSAKTGIARMTLTRRLADPGSMTLAELDRLASALDIDPVAVIAEHAAA